MRGGCGGKLGFGGFVGGILGCGGSKDVDETILVKLCRERKDMIKAAGAHRYALAAAHLCYLKSLKDIGESLEKFVDEEIVVGGSSEPDSPVLTLPSEEGKKRRSDGKSESSSTSISHSASHSHNHSSGVEEEDAHLHLSSGSDSELDPSHGRMDDIPLENVYYRSEMEAPYYPHYDSYQTTWGPPNENSNAYYMTKTPTKPLRVFKIPQVSVTNSIKREPRKDPKRHVTAFKELQGLPNSGYENGLSDSAYDCRKSTTRKQVTIPKHTCGKSELNGSPPEKSEFNYMRRAPTVPNTGYGYDNPQESPPNRFWQDTSNNNPNYSQHNNGGFFGFLSGSSIQNESYNTRVQQNHPPPPEPPAPSASGWDFMNIFNTWDQDQYQPSFYSKAKHKSTSSSPDSKEVREREGIPNLEYETESETIKVDDKGKKLQEEYPNYGEGTSRPAPSQFSDESFWTMSSHRTGGTSRVIPPRRNRRRQDRKNNADHSLSNSSEEELTKKKNVTFGMDRSPMHDIESVRPDNTATLVTHSVRDLQDVVKEIKNEFQTASENGKEILLILEVGTLPYQSRPALLKAMLHRILALKSSSKSPSSRQYMEMASKTMKMAKTLYGDLESELNRKPGNLSFVLDELYAWEKKLYKEVKDEERLRISYEKACKRLRGMYVQGAEPTKIEGIQDSVKKYLTKIKVQIKSIEAISSRINILRDKELEPQLIELIQGLIQMWKSMLTCHQKQFIAIMASKHRTLKANVGFRRDSSLRAAFELEMELVNWCSNFRTWIASQKEYIKSLNSWLMKCLSQEREVTADGPVPFSPGRMNAPRVFIICHDWFQAMERVSDDKVKMAMDEFASMLHQLWETQDIEQRQRLRSEDLIKQYETRLQRYRMEKGRMENEHESAVSERTAGSMVHSENKISQLDDLKSDLDSMRKRFEEERARHKESLKQIHSTASDSIQSGLIPIFESLKNFSSEALQAHEQVRLQNSESAA